jgi:hypothetical protein
MPAKMFPHLKLLCLLFMGTFLVLTQSKETVFLIKFGGVFFTIKALTIDIKRKDRSLKVCYVPATSAASSKAFFCGH